jgi:hypothetical protein
MTEPTLHPGATVKWNLRVRPPLPSDSLAHRKRLQERFDEYRLSWHFGTVVTVADASDLDGPYAEIEYTHSVEPINYPAGTKVRIHNFSKIAVL